MIPPIIRAKAVSDILLPAPRITATAIKKPVGTEADPTGIKIRRQRFFDMGLRISDWSDFHQATHNP